MHVFRSQFKGHPFYFECDLLIFSSTNIMICVFLVTPSGLIVQDQTGLLTMVNAISV